MMKTMFGTPGALCPKSEIPPRAVPHSSVRRVSSDMLSIVAPHRRERRLVGVFYCDVLLAAVAAFFLNGFSLLQNCFFLPVSGGWFGSPASAPAGLSAG